MRDVILFAIILVSLPISFLKPHIGIYFWYWITFMNPHRFTYGFMYSFPVALLSGAATMAGALLLRRKAPLLRSPEMVLLLTMTVLFTLNTMVAMFPTAWIEWEKVVKVLIMTFFTVVLIDTRPKLRMVLIVTVLSIGFVSCKGAIWGVLTGGQYRLWGPEGSALEDNNSMALALNVHIPMALFLAKTEQRPRVRLAFLVIALFSLFGVVLTYSRGGLLGLAAVLVMLTYRARRSVGLIFLMIVAFGTILVFIPHTWYDRMKTIETYEEDDSAMQRIETWKFAWSLALQRPLTGGGFEGFRANPSQGRNPHSIYFGMLGEQGFVVFFLFIALLASCYTGLARIEKRTRGRPELAWYADLSAMLRVSLVGYMVSGTFLNLQYFDLFYLLVALVAIMRYLVRVESAALASAPGAPQQAPVKRKVRWGPERVSPQSA